MKHHDKIKLAFYPLIFLLSATAKTETLGASYADIPPSYETLSPAGQIADSSVNFHAVEIDLEAGYKVTDPNGNTFYVDNIDQPDCVFYATYIETTDGVISSDIEVESNIYIENLNLEGCE